MECTDSFIKDNANILNNYKHNYVIIENNRVIDNDIIGVDLGIEKLATCSDGTCYENSHFYRNEYKKIGELQKKLEGQIEGSKNYKKTEERIAKTHAKISNRRLDYNHKVSKKIVLTCRTAVVVEDLDVQKMIAKHPKNHSFNREIMDTGWYQTRNFIKYKCEKYGKMYVEVNPKDTSKRCSGCGEVVEKELGCRIHNCPHCGLIMDRDLNAAVNIRELGKEKILARNLPCGDQSAIQQIGGPTEAPSKP